MNSTVKILIVDDDPDDSEFLIEGISNALSSYTVDTVSDSVNCLTFLKTNDPPEFIFLDLNMPRKNGIECLKCLRQNALLDNTHVIIYSTSNSSKDIDTCYELGARFYIVKPVCFSTMVDHLTRVFTELNKEETGIADLTSFVISDRQKVSA